MASRASIRKTSRKTVKATKKTSQKRHTDVGFLFENHPSPMWVYELESLAFLAVNDAAVEKYGYTRAEFKRMTIKDIRPEEDVNRLIADVERARPELQHSGEWRHRAKDGRVIDVEITSHMLKFDGRDAALVMAEDITDRKRAEQALRDSEERLAGIIASAMDAIISIDSEQRIVMFNAAAEKMFRCSANKAIGRPLEHFIPERFRAAHKTYVSAFAETGVTSRSMGKLNPLSGLRTDGEEFPIEASISQVKVGGQKLLTVILRDITERKHAEEESQLFASIVESANDAIIGKDLNGIVRSWNPAAERMYGYPAREIIGESVLITYPPDKSDELQTIMEKIINGERVEHYETQRVARDGHHVDISLTASPIQDQTGRIIGASSIGRDITERKHAEEALRQSEERYRSTLDAMLEGAQIISNDWRYLYLNDTAAEQGRQPKENLLGRTMMEVYPGIETTALFTALQRCIKEQISQQMDNEFVYPDGDSRWFKLSIQPVPEGIFILSMDITDRRRAEMEILKLNMELEERVAQRTAALEAANKELEAFSYSVSHDLRAPLRAIDGFSQALLEDYHDQLPSEGQDYLRRVRASAQRMAQLIDDMLNLSRVTRAPLEIQQVDLSNVAERVCDGLRQMQPERQVTFSIEPGLFANGDPHLLEIMLENLLGNAWKFTSKREQARIEFGLLAPLHLPPNSLNFGGGSQGDQGGTFFIRDNGAGFDMTYAGKLFGAFQRLHSLNDFPGTGIGLATVQRIINRHGGKIWAEGKVNEGATFYFTF